MLPFLFIWPANAQQNATEPAAPALLECGVHGDIEILCGTHSPEDLELTPDGKFLIATQFIDQGRGGAGGGGMKLLDLAKKTFNRMAERAEPDKSWGDPTCPGPIGDALVSHGSSLAKRSNGVWELYVVNHGGRQSIEMYELRQASGTWTLVWHGCELALHDYNDVAILPDDGFVGTYSSGLSAGNTGTVSSGGPTGYVARWTRGKGEFEVPDTRMRGPNGVVVSADGRYMYVNEFPARLVHKYDLTDGRKIGAANVDFLRQLDLDERGPADGCGSEGCSG
jgi:hypothetical protein